MQIELTAIYEPQPDGWIMSRIAEIPGVVTQGRTMEEAREMLADALTQMLECNREIQINDSEEGAIVERFDVPTTSMT